MEVPGLGQVTEDEDLGWICSEPLSIPVLDGAMCEIALEGYNDDPAKEDFHRAVQNFLAITPAVLKEVASDLFRYYQDCNADWSETDEQFVAIASPDEVWDHVDFGFEAIVSRRSEDNAIYISLECPCEWEAEHGLQIVFRNGLKVNKLGPYDCHLTNSDAYARKELEDVVYR